MALLCHFEWDAATLGGRDLYFKGRDENALCKSGHPGLPGSVWVCTMIALNGDDGDD